MKIAFFEVEDNNIHNITKTLGIDSSNQPLYVFDDLDDGLVVCSTHPLDENTVYRFLDENL